MRHGCAAAAPGPRRPVPDYDPPGRGRAPPSQARGGQAYQTWRQRLTGRRRDALSRRRHRIEPVHLTRPEHIGGSAEILHQELTIWASVGRWNWETQGMANTRVPVQLTSFVGRSRELAELEVAVGAARLVTVVGPGGSGKTRLALEFAARRRAASPDLHFVDLTPITDPALVPVSIATILGVREVAGEALQDTLARRIGDREVVLVLDNLEQLPAAGSVIAELLAASPGLRVLATSRAPLHVRGEQEYRLAPLRLPGPVELASLKDLAEVEAVKLFVERARAIDPAFALTRDNAVAVAGILRPPGRVAAGDRAGRGPHPAVHTGRPARSPGPATTGPDGRADGCTDPPAHPPLHDRVEL